MAKNNKALGVSEGLCMIRDRFWINVPHSCKRLLLPSYTEGNNTTSYEYYDPPSLYYHCSTIWIEYTNVECLINIFKYFSIILMDYRADGTLLSPLEGRFPFFQEGPGALLHVLRPETGPKGGYFSVKPVNGLIKYRVGGSDAMGHGQGRFGPDHL
jgi:hypothetical protein